MRLCSTWQAPEHLRTCPPTILKKICKHTCLCIHICVCRCRSVIYIYIYIYEYTHDMQNKQSQFNDSRAPQGDYTVLCFLFEHAFCALMCVSTHAYIHTTNICDILYINTRVYVFKYTHTYTYFIYKYMYRKKWESFLEIIGKHKNTSSTFTSNRPLNTSSTFTSNRPLNTSSTFTSNPLVGSPVIWQHHLCTFWKVHILETVSGQVEQHGRSAGTRDGAYLRNGLSKRCTSL